MTNRTETDGLPQVAGPWAYLWWLIMSQWRRIVLGAILGSSWMIGLTLPPYLLSRAIDEGLRSGHTTSLLLWAGALLVVGLLNAWLSIMRHRTMTKVRVDAAYRSVSAITGHAIRLGATLPRRVRAGEVVTIGLGDVWAIARSLTTTGPGVGAAIAYVVIAALLLSLSPLLAAIVLLGVPVLAIIVGPLLGRVQRVGMDYREREGSLTGRMIDIIDGLRVLNGLGGKERYAERYRHESQALRAEGYRVGAITSWVQALGVGLPALFLAVVIWLAARMAASGTISIGELVAVYGYLAVLVMPVSFFIEGGLDISRALVAARRVVGFLAVQDDRATVANATGSLPPAPALLVDPQTGVVLEPGTFTAIATPVRADATRLVDRLGAVGDTTATWGDQALAPLPTQELRDRILVADHESMIFAGSLRNVISGRTDRADATLISAVHAAAAGDVVAELEFLSQDPSGSRPVPSDDQQGGLDALISSRGHNLSGGQQQRIRLARALAADSEVLLLIDPTSAVDSLTEATIAARLREIRATLTTLVVSTSPLLLEQADVVFVLMDGSVIDHGKHHELLKRCQRYRDLVSRASGEDDRP